MKKQFSESRTSFELRLIGGWRNEDWLLALNPVFGWNLSDGLRSSTADVSFGAKAARTVAKDLALGFEFYADAGTTKQRSFARQPRTLYAVVDTRVKAVDLNFGIGRGLDSAADKWTVKAIFGIPF